MDRRGRRAATNDRAAAAEIFAAHEGEKPWFGIEQEYTLFNMDQTTPLGWPAGGYPGPQGPYYCSAGAGRAFGRAVSEAHYKACLYAGISISGTNAEVMPGQWEYQVGPCVGIAAGDELWASRYILDRVCEEFNVHVTYEPKPIKGDWNGAGAHINFSTEKMREAGGIEEIVTACEKLRVYRAEHIAIYGENNEERSRARTRRARSISSSGASPTAAARSASRATRTPSCAATSSTAAPRRTSTRTARPRRSWRARWTRST